jgi:hypothetical protein
LLLYLNYTYWPRLRRLLLVWFGAVLVLGVLLPVISILLEWRLFGPKPSEDYDGFNLLYVYLRVPLYWLLLFLQSIVLLIKDELRPR